MQVKLWCSQGVPEGLGKQFGPMEVTVEGEAETLEDVVSLCEHFLRGAGFQFKAGEYLAVAGGDDE